MKQRSAPSVKNTSGATKKAEIQESKPRFAGLAASLIILAVAAIPFSLGRYFEIHFPDPYDSGAYVYSAQHIVDGAKIGVDENPTAQQGTLLVNMLGVWTCGYSELGPKLVQSFLQAVALVLMFYTTRKCFGTLAAAVSVLMASIYLSAPLIAKFGNVKEQHMIAFMVIGVCCYVLRQMGGKWWLAVLAGAALAWGPMFKQTGVSSLAAVGVYALITPLLKTRTLREALADIGLLLGGFVLGIAPVVIWLAYERCYNFMPYAFIWQVLKPAPVSAGSSGGYVAGARAIFGFAKQWPIVTAYYGCLILPIALSTTSILVWLWRRLRKIKQAGYEPFVILFSIWWILDMALVWVSPRSYEQYYLPLCASAAMLGGYAIAIYRDATKAAHYHPKWLLVGGAGFVAMVFMSLHIFIGIEKSPFSGQRYRDRATGNPGRDRGYVQRWDEVQDMIAGATMDWQQAGDYIREHSGPTDRIYVWGWYPGIYVRAQRLSSAALAFESEMHAKSPQELAKTVDTLLTAFKAKPPKFLVDSRKFEFPWDRPPLPLWPTSPDGKLMQGTASEIEQFDSAYAAALNEKFPQEGDRYTVMKPLRDYITTNYKIVGTFGDKVLFERK